LKEILDIETNIVTVEDPVEYRLEGVTQIETKEQIGLTFSTALRSVLRQDPTLCSLVKFVTKRRQTLLLSSH